MNGIVIIQDEQRSEIARVEYSGRWCGIVWCEICGDCMKCYGEISCYFDEAGVHIPVMYLSDFEAEVVNRLGDRAHE